MMAFTIPRMSLVLRIGLTIPMNHAANPMMVTTYPFTGH